MSYLDLFQRYGRPSREADIRLSGWLLRPEDLTADKIAGYDKRAARLTAEAQALITQMSEYRQALAARYATLATAAYRDRLELTRRRAWRNAPVYYDVKIIRTYEDGATETTLNETYPGKQRREALSRYDELRKQRPGIETVKDIAPKAWEH